MQPSLNGEEIVLRHVIEVDAAMTDVLAIKDKRREAMGRKH